MGHFDGFKLYFEGLHTLYYHFFLDQLKTSPMRVWDNLSEAELEEFEPRLKFERRLKYGRFHLKLYTMFQDLRRTQLKFIKFGLRAENFRMVDIGINAWSSLLDNLKINIIVQDYPKSVWKTIKFKLILNHLSNCSSQSEKSGQPMREQKYSHWRKQFTDIQGERKRVD